MRLKHLLSVFLTLLTLSIGQMWGAHTLVKASQMATGEKYIIVAEHGNNAYYLVPGNFAVKNSTCGTYTNSLTEDAAWTFTKSGDKWLISTKVSNTTYYLGHNSANNGVRTSSDSQEYTISATSTNASTVYLYANGRYLYEYNGGENWRCYTGSSQSGSVSTLKLYKVSASYTITAQSNNNNWGTVSGTTTITASPQTGYRVSTSSPYSVSPANSATVSQDGNTFSVTASANTTITINFEAIPTHTVTWSVNGNTSNTSIVAEGAAITFPNTATGCNGGSFRGWTANAIDGTQATAPTYVTSANMGNSDITYYAVFATENTGGTTTVTDELTQISGITSTTYTAFSNKTYTSSAVYAGKCAGSNTSIQLNTTSPNGVWTTSSGGKAKKVTVTWNSSTANGRTLDVYGKNSAYASGDLYSSTASTQGTLLGSIVCGTSTELNISGDYAYIGFRSQGSAMYLTKVAIDWSTSAGTTYSDFRTSCCTSLASINGSFS